MKSETKKTPALRFRAFDGDWTEEKIGDVTSYVDYRGKTPPKSESGVFLVTAKNVKVGYIDYECSKEYIPKDSYNEVMRRGQPLLGDVLITTEAPLGNVASIDRIGVALAQRIIKLRGKENVLSNDFLKQTLLSESFQRLLCEKSSGSTAKGIKGSVLHKLPLVFPSIAEQQKIGAFLSALDEKIRQLTKKKELLLEYKKAVMQQIFSQKIRFKKDDGNDFPDWEEKRFDEVFSFLPTNSFSREDLNCLDGEVKNIHYGDIHTKFRPLLNIDDEEVPFINKQVSLAGIPEANYLRTGDLVFADASEDYADVGKCIEIGSTNGQRMLSGLHTLLARPKANELANVFGTYLMKSWSVRQQIMREAQGTKVLGISTRRLSKIRLRLPSIAEQARIARFISTIEKKIEIVSQQWEGTKTFQKGLLQQMFV